VCFVVDLPPVPEAAGTLAAAVAVALVVVDVVATFAATVAVALVLAVDADALGGSGSVPIAICWHGATPGTFGADRPE
jgi:hypothetical protein